MKVTHNGKELFEVVIPDEIPDEIEIMDISNESGLYLLAISVIFCNDHIRVNEQNMNELVEEYDRYKIECEKQNKKKKVKFGMPNNKNRVRSISARIGQKRGKRQ